MISKFYTGLPKEIKINNINYKINTDFRVWLKVMDLLKSDMQSFEKIAIIKRIVFTKEAPRLDVGALEELLSFLTCYSVSGDSCKGSEILLDYQDDAREIYSAFIKTFNIDLSECKYMHIWKFNALLGEARKDTILGNKISLREINVRDLISSGRYKENSKEINKLNEAKNKVFLGHY